VKPQSFVAKAVAPSNSRYRRVRDKIRTFHRIYDALRFDELGLIYGLPTGFSKLASSLAECLCGREASTQRKTALDEAERAVDLAFEQLSAVLVTFVKRTARRIERKYQFKLGSSNFADLYQSAERAIVRLTSGKEDVVDNLKLWRLNHASIHEIEHWLLIVSEFAIFFPEIELVAKTGRRSFEGWLEKQIHLALHENPSLTQFQVELQPKIRLSNKQTMSRKCIGAEALVRLRIGNETFLPNQFIDIVEKMGLIPSVGKSVLRQTLHILDRHKNIPVISVNVHPLELLSPEYFETFSELLQEYESVAKNRIEVEITEQVAIRDVKSREHLIKLANLGISIAIDDFGTGKTKFDYFAKLPVKVIKVDQSLVRNLTEDEHYWKLVKAIGAIAKTNKYAVIVEGIETTDQAKRFFEAGLKDHQGYLYDKSMTSSAFVEKYFRW
jgi:EAL domain-containing protein (putative c-di-GMP-specific phosphodiesterase class I)